MARLAGVPIEIIEDAKQMMAAIEKPGKDQWPVDPIFPKPGPVKRKKKSRSDGQLELFNTRETDLMDMLKQVDISNMTPLQGLNFLHEIKQKAGV